LSPSGDGWNERGDEGEFTARQQENPLAMPILARTSAGRGHHLVSEMNQFVLVYQPSDANPLKIQDRKPGPLRAICNGMTAKLVYERPVTIGALTAIAEGVMPNASGTPISLIWTLLQRVFRKR
jgi:hypothetical protein